MRLDTFLAQRRPHRRRLSVLPDRLSRGGPSAPGAGESEDLERLSRRAAADLARTHFNNSETESYRMRRPQE